MGEGLARLIGNDGQPTGRKVRFQFTDSRTLAHPRRKVMFTNEPTRLPHPHVGDRIVVRVGHDHDASAWTYAPIWDRLKRDLDPSGSQNRYRVIERTIPAPNPVMLDRVVWEGVGIAALTKRFPWQDEEFDTIDCWHGNESRTRGTRAWTERLMNGIWRKCADPRIVRDWDESFDDLDVLALLDPANFA